MILHYTPKQSGDYELLINVLHLYEQTLTKVNQVTKEKENRQKLEEIQALIGGEQMEELNLLKDTKTLGKREFIHEGFLMKAKSNRKLKGYLFNDLLLLIQTQRNKSMVYRQPIPLNEILVREPSAVSAKVTNFLL